MSSLTLELPESLHRQLSAQAEQEGISLKEYLLYALAHLVSVADLQAQKERFNRLVGQYPPDEAEKALHTLLAARQSS